MVIARSQVNVTAQAPAFPAHHQHHLRMGLVADDAVDDVSAGLLQCGGQFDIGFLIEAGAQLDHHGDFLAGTGRILQRIDQGGIIPGTVQGLFDRQVRWDRWLPGARSR